jgi:hypothetical protein
MGIKSGFRIILHTGLSTLDGKGFLLNQKNLAAIPLISKLKRA